MAELRLPLGTAGQTLTQDIFFPFGVSGVFAHWRLLFCLVLVFSELQV
jgi:hypothetical protein